MCCVSRNFGDLFIQIADGTARTFFSGVLPRQRTSHSATKLQTAFLNSTESQSSRHVRLKEVAHDTEAAQRSFRRSSLKARSWSFELAFFSQRSGQAKGSRFTETGKCT
jgi:hypothetical protein